METSNIMHVPATIVTRFEEFMYSLKFVFELFF